MSGKKKKVTKKQSRRIKVFILTTGLLICCCIVIGILINVNLTGDYYKIEKRTSYITKEKKLDEEGVETVAWLRVQGTNIDAPIIIPDEGKSLGFLEKENFLWNEDDVKSRYNQIKIMGHNILNLSSNPEVGTDYFTKFEDLMAFTYQDFVKENKYIQYTVDGKDYIYKIFAVIYDKSYNLDLYHNGDYTTEEMKEYITKVQEKSLYEFDIEVDEKDDIICLVTCTRMYGVDQKQQFMVVGRLLRKNEQIKNYTSKTTKEYDKLQKIMKGETENVEA